MSSPRQAVQSDGVLEMRDRAVGPIRLPSDGTESFLRRFNEEYAGLGMSIVMPCPDLQHGPVIPTGRAPPDFSGRQNSNGRASSGKDDPLQRAVLENIAKALAATFCGSRGERTRGGNLESREGLLSLLDRVSFATASRSLGGASAVAHIEQIIQVLRQGTQTLTPESPPGDLRPNARLQTAHDDEQWRQLRQQLADAYHTFASVIPLLDISQTQALAVCFSVLNHSAYHFGILRQKLAMLRPA